MYIRFDVSRYRVKKVGDRYHVEEGRWWVLLIVPLLLWEYCTSFVTPQEAVEDIQRRVVERYNEGHPLIVAEFGKYGEFRGNV